VTPMHGVRFNRRRQRTHLPRLRIGRCASRASPQVDDVLSGVSFVMQPMRHDAWRLRAIASRLALHSALHGQSGFLRVRAHARVRSHVQMACPERAKPMAWAALAGQSAAPCAAPPGHRIPVPSGRGKMQGKIKGRGTSLRAKPVCTWGWHSTRLIAAPCRVVSQCLVSIEESACFACWLATGLDGASA
jgi:hypothetical protein